jgi:hypothetical protein
MSNSEKIQVLENELELTKQILAEVLKVVCGMSDGSEYYTMRDNFTQKALNFKYDNLFKEKE